MLWCLTFKYLKKVKVRDSHYSYMWTNLANWPLRAPLLQVQSFLLHFWQGMPEHMMAILDSQTIVLLVGVCDTMLYKAIANVLMPTVLQALPDRFCVSISSTPPLFWLNISMKKTLISRNTVYSFDYNFNFIGLYIFYIVQFLLRVFICNNFCVNLYLSFWNLDSTCKEFFKN